MRRITFTIVTTVAILVLLFSYRTSRNQSITPSTVAIGQAHVLSPATTAPAAASGPGPATASQSAAGQVTVPSTASTAPSVAPAAGGNPTSSTSQPTTKPAAPPTKSSSALTVTVDGATVGTQFGDVKVEVVIVAGKITDVRALTYPTAFQRDQEINQIAIPELRSQVLAAQSANIAGVGGATYTTQGYVGSLQSALDQVHFP